MYIYSATWKWINVWIVQNSSHTQSYYLDYIYSKCMPNLSNCQTEDCFSNIWDHRGLLFKQIAWSGRQTKSHSEKCQIPLKKISFHFFEQTQGRDNPTSIHKLPGNLLYERCFLWKKHPLLKATASAEGKLLVTASVLATDNTSRLTVTTSWIQLFRKQGWHRDYYKYI